MTSFTPTEIFTPNDYPRHTYVDRVMAPPLEDRLRNALSIPKEVVSVSGPSKSGKTVLVERVIGIDNLITVSGPEIQTPGDLWDAVLNWMGTPSSVATTKTGALLSGKTGQLTGTLGVPLIAKGDLTVSTQSSDTQTKANTETRNRSGLSQVV